VSEELQEIIDSNPEWYKDLLYRDVKIFIRDNINSASRSFVAIGYYLKYVRDNQLFAEDGYQDIWDFAKGEFGIGKSSASQFMSINDKFSKDGNSPILLEQYKDFTSSKLAEMLTMSNEQLEQVTPATTIVEIRQIKNPKMEETVLTSEQDPVTIDDLDFTVRTYNCLRHSGIETIEELCDLTEDDVIKIRNISRKCLDEIKSKLSEIGRSLKPDMDDIPETVNDEPEIVDNMPEIVNDVDETFIHIYELNNEPYGWTRNQIIHSLIERIIETKFKLPGMGALNIKTLGIEYYILFAAEIGIYESNKLLFKVTQERLQSEVENYIASNQRENEGSMDEDVIEESDPVEAVEADIIQTEPEETFTDQCETSGLKFNNWLKANGSSIADIVSIVLYDKKIPDKDNLHAQIQNSLISRLISKTEAYYCYLTRELEIKPERPRQLQPELPILKNNDLRAAFIDAYATWPLWIEIEESAERYYRYILSDKVAMVVKVSLRHSWREKDPLYGNEQYYLLGINADWTQNGTVFKQDDTRTFADCNCNRGALIEYLKEIQKKGA
jgi:hypothetical protein